MKAAPHTRRSRTGRAAVRIALIMALGLLCGLAMAPGASAGTYQADGSYTGTPSADVTAIFAAYPNGGDGLIDAIRELLIANPGLADDIAYVASRASPSQQADAGTGMAQAFTALTHGGNISGASRIVSAAQHSGNSIIQTAVGTAVSGIAVFADQSGNPVTGKSNCRPPVSPSAPTTCQ